MEQRFSLCGTLRNGRRASRVPAHCGQYLERSCLRCRWADHPRRGAAGDREPRRSWAWHPGRAGSAGNLVAARRRSMSRSAAANTSGGIRSGSRTQANWSNWPDKPGPPRGSPGLSPGCGYRSQTGKHGRDGLGARCSATSDTVTFRAHHRPHITGLGQAEWHHRHDGAGGRVPVSTAVPSPGLHPVVSDRCNATCAPSVLCGRTCFTVGKMGALTNDTRRAKFQRKRKFRRSVPPGRSARCRPSRSSGCESAQRADPLRPSKVLARVTQFPLGWQR